MAYKRYIKRGNKLYGPYIYSSRKENGKVISDYVGKGSVTKKSQRILNIFLILFGVFIIFIFGYFINSFFTGNIILQMENSYSENENLSGYLSFVLEKEEFIPASTKILINNSKEIYEYSLLDLIGEEETSEGKFYIRDTNISGEGLGYGVEFPVINFVLRIYNETEINETISEDNETEINETAKKSNETISKTKGESDEETEEESEQSSEIIEINKTEEINQTLINESEINETISEDNETEINETGNITEINQTEDNQTEDNQTEDNQTEDTLEESEERINESTEEEITESVEEETIEKNLNETTEETETGITGQIIRGISKITSKLYFTLTGHSISGRDIEGQISKGEKFIYNLSEGQNAEIISSTGEVNLEIEDNNIVVTTNSTRNKREIILNLEKLKIPAEDGKLKVSLVYNNTELAFIEKEISVKSEQILLNETNLTEENITIGNLSEIIEKRTKKQFKAIINRPVKWIEIIDTANKSLKIDIPKEAKNITIKKGKEIEDSLREVEEYDEIIKKADRKEFIKEIESKTKITGDVSLDIEKGKGFLYKLFNLFSQAIITGKVISEEQIKENITETDKNKIIQLKTNATEKKNESIAIEYYTNAPVSNETTIPGVKGGKRIIISASDELNYTEILAYTLLENEVPIESSERIKLYWYASEEDAIRYGYLNETSGEAINETIENEIIKNNESEVQAINNTNQSDSSIINNENNLTNATASENEILNESEINITEEITNESAVNNDSINEVGNLSINDSVIENINETSSDNSSNTSINNSNNSLITGLITGFAVSENNENSEEISTSSKIRIEVDYDAYDLDDDGYIDYIEWIVPHLSSQVYEMIIEVSKAEHLNKNRDFISDITEEVIKKDDNWSEAINNSEYVRAYFKENLSSDNDITIYARSLGNDSASVEIYTKNGNNKIAIINNINEEEYYQTYLTNLSNSTDVFDLKIISDYGVEFDYIVDPALTVIINETNDYLYMQNRTEASTHGARLDAPILFMDFNEENESTYVRDKSIYNNYGTINGNPVYNSSCSSPIGDGGGCYEFDGDGDYIDVGSSSFAFSNDEDFSASIWFMVIGLPEDGNVVGILGRSSGGKWAIDHWFDGEKLRFGVREEGTWSIQTEFTSDDYNKWHHAVLVHKANEVVEGYLNGDFVGDTSFGEWSVDGKIMMGHSNAAIGGTPKNFNGSIDNVQIWDRALEAWEIQELYNGTYNTSETIGKYARTGNFSSYGYYNESGAVYWNITSSIADSDGEGLNLSHPNLVSYWALDGDYKDSKENNDGTCSAGTCPHNSTGLSSDAMFFDGVEDYLSISVSDSTTISYWKKNSTDSSWYHIVNSSNGFYINGINTTSQTIYVNKTVIGRSDSGNYFDGVMDEVAIYNTSLTASEIDELYKIGLSQHADTNVTLFYRTASSYNLSNSKLVSFWSFNEQNADDEMGRNDGTNYGATWAQEAGVVGGGYSFSENDYISVDETKELNPSKISIEFWFKPDENYDSETNYVSLLSHEYYEVYVDNGNIVFEYEGSKVNSSTSTWNKNQWYHVLVTYDGLSQTIYINSVNESSAVATLVAPFKIKDSAGNNVASFFDSGNLILKGKCFAKTDCTAPGDTSFIIQTSGNVVAYINSSGDLCIEDSNCNDYDENCDNPGDNSFIVKNSTLNNVIYINSTGNLCLIRTLTENGNP